MRETRNRQHRGKAILAGRDLRSWRGEHIREAQLGKRLLLVSHHRQQDSRWWKNSHLAQDLRMMDATATLAPETASSHFQPEQDRLASLPTSLNTGFKEALPNNGPSRTSQGQLPRVFNGVNAILLSELM